MGIGSSAHRGEAAEDEVKPPSLRAKDRYVARDTTVIDSDVAAFDPTADKYDYLIVFKNETKKKKDDDEMLSWPKLMDVWLQAIPGEEDKKEKGVALLRAKWAAKFGAPTDQSSELRSEVETLVRDHIIDVLSRRSGLQLKLSLSPLKTRQYCQVRAPMNLLELKADQLDYKLKFKPQVDPGSAFWERTDGVDPATGRPRYVELVEEQRTMTKDRANEVLGLLYRAGKIGPRDMCVFDDEETTEKHWSRRVRTLERIVDKVPCTNEYPAYAAFDRNPKDRHLYDEYPSVRGTTLFLAKDRLYLTKRIIDEVFDFGVLKREKLVEFLTALHDANFGEIPTADWFLKRWVYFYQAEPDRVGGPYVTHHAIGKNQKCPFLLRPWAQPFMEIRSYFGEKIAFYFAWLGFYGYYLIHPALAGLVCVFYQTATATSDESVGLHPEQIFMAFFLVSWSAYYKEYWDIESQYCALKWGTVNFEEEEVDRPQFHGDPDGERRRISPVTNQNETYYPAEKRQATQRVSITIIVLFIIILIVVMVMVFELEYLMYLQGGILADLTGAVGLVQAILIKVLSDAYGEFANARNDLENYRTQTEFENQLVLKKFLFEIFNNYSALAITAYFKGPYFACTSGVNQQNCLGDLKSLLQSIIGTRFALAIYSATEERVNKIIEIFTGPSKAEKDDDDQEEEADEDSDEETGQKAQQQEGVQESQRFESELELKDYEGTFDDYAEIVLQMGLVSMFTLGWYLVPTFGVIEVLVQIRVDAYKLAAQTKRPDPSPAESVGTWGVLMESMGLLAVWANAGIIVFTTRSFSRYSVLERVLIFFALEQIALIVKVFTHACIQDVPTDLYEKQRRNDHVVKRHKIVVFEDDDDDGFDLDDDEDEAKRRAKRRRQLLESGLPDDIEQKREAERQRIKDVAKRASDLAVQRGAVDPDLLDVTALKPEKLTRLNQQRLEYLRRMLLGVDKDLALLRGQYKVACRHEVYRPRLGVSYSRKDPDLALGLFTVTLHEAIGIGTMEDRIGSPKNVRVIAHVRDVVVQKEETPLDVDKPVGPPPQVSKPARKPKQPLEFDVGERLAFNHTFSLAPIRRAWAVLHLEILEEVGGASSGEPFSDDEDEEKRPPQQPSGGGPVTQRRRGHAELPLSKFMDQRPHKDLLVRVIKPGTVPPEDEDDSNIKDGPHLLVTAQFQYSKLVPIKTRILELLTEQKKLHRTFVVRFLLMTFL